LPAGDIVYPKTVFKMAIKTVKFSLSKKYLFTDQFGQVTSSLWHIGGARITLAQISLVSGEKVSTGRIKQ